jgi:hypothetical protein
LVSFSSWLKYPVRDPRFLFLTLNFYVGILLNALFREACETPARKSFAESIFIFGVVLTFVPVDAQNNIVATWGSGDFGQLGLGMHPFQTSIFRQVGAAQLSSEGQVVKIFTAWAHSAALTCMSFPFIGGFKFRRITSVPRILCSHRSRLGLGSEWKRHVPMITI